MYMVEQDWGWTKDGNRQGRRQDASEFALAPRARSYLINYPQQLSRTVACNPGPGLLFCADTGGDTGERGSCPFLLRTHPC